MKIHDINYGQARALKGLILREQDKVNAHTYFIIGNRQLSADKKNFELKKQNKYFKELEALYDMFEEVITAIEEDSYDDEVIEEKTLKDIEE
jgi:hypothetical protein